MSWIDKITSFTSAAFQKSDSGSKHEIPEGVWTKCESCDQVLYRSELERNLNVCPKCGHHMRITARARLNAFLDKEGSVELGADLVPKDVLRFKDLKRYKDRYTQAQKSTNEKDALVVQKGTLKGIPVVACAFEFGFMAGSMGSVVGARFCLAAQECLKEGRALVCFSTSGGARMQESLLSLMQMAKTSAVLAKLSQEHLPFISVMADPTMGGVSASLAMLGDVNIAEPNALIGFAGPRVIEQTVREKLPEGFQRAEFLLEKGAIDMIISRQNLRDEIAELLAKMMNYELNGEVYSLHGSVQEADAREIEVLNVQQEQSELSNADLDLEAAALKARENQEGEEYAAYVQDDAAEGENVVEEKAKKSRRKSSKRSSE